MIDPANTFAAEVISDGAPRVVTGLGATSQPTDMVRIVGAESGILVPITGPGVERGMLAVFRGPQRPAFAPAEVEAATMFAAQMTLALELADSRARRERLALLDERDRIARDLHDHVIQRLFAIGLSLQSVGVGLEGEAGKRLLAGVDDIDDTIGQIRSTIYRLTGPVLGAENSIRARIARLVDEIAPLLGFRANYEIHGPVDFGVTDEVTHDCIAVLREALTNVAKHADASSVFVSVALSPDVLTLQVADDGRGIGRSSRRSGLANLRARAERRGGELTVTSGDAGGTRLTWSVPVAAG
jgi:signal transduction histidine kinase